MFGDRGQGVAALDLVILPGPRTAQLRRRDLRALSHLDIADHLADALDVAGHQNGLFDRLPGLAGSVQGDETLLVSDAQVVDAGIVGQDMFLDGLGGFLVAVEQGVSDIGYEIKQAHDVSWCGDG